MNKFIVANWHVYRFPVLESTNDEAREIALKGNSLTVVWADKQTAGKGRQNREWFSDNAKGFWLSLVCPVAEGNLHKPERWPLIIAQSVLEGLQNVAAAEYRLKWPNDIILAGRKLAGILTESVWQGENLQAVIAGIGINVEQNFDDFPTEIRGRAISLREWHSRQDFDRLVILESILSSVNKWMSAVSNNQVWQKMLSLHRRNSLTLSRPIRIYNSDEQVVDGMAVDIDKDGRLEVIDKKGKRILVDAGEVSVRILSAGKETYV